MGSGRGREGWAGEYVWPCALAANGGGALQKTHHCSLEVQCAWGAPGHALQPQLWSSLTPTTRGQALGKSQHSLASLQNSTVLKGTHWG